MDFITTDSKLTIEGSTIRQKKLTDARRRDLWLYAFFFLFGINVLWEKIATSLETGRAIKWVSVAIWGAVVLLYLVLLFGFLFRQYWKNEIAVSNINKITVRGDDAGLETYVVITMRSNRYKLFKFRTLEKQYAGFIDTVRSLNTRINVVAEN